MKTAIRFKGALLALLAVLAITTLHVIIKMPLQDVHWDAAIYLMRGKMLAETPLLQNYQIHAKEIADALPQYEPGVVDTPYWGFMRLGNTLLLGAVAAIAGTDMTALRVANGLYVFLMASSLICATLLSLRIAEILGIELPNRYVTAGAVVSAGLYLASDIYRHLSGNLVAEMPAMFLITASLFSLVEAVRLRSLALAVLSGLLAFAVYVFKMELVWVYVSFILLYAFLLSRNASTKMYLSAFVISGLVALGMYGLYAWWFHPLADPRLFITFASITFAWAHEHASPHAVASVKLVFVASGLLWIGMLLALRYQFRHPVVWLSLAWLVAIVIPLLGGAAQARFFAVVMPPLLLGSTIGWAALLDRLESNKTNKLWLASLLIGILALLGLSHAETYKWIRQVPGSWRLQDVKSYLSPPRYERLDFPLKELQEISQFLYGHKEPTIVILENGVPEEYSNIITYFGPRLPYVDQFIGNPAGTCGRTNLRPDLGPVMFCTSPPTEQSIHNLAGKVRILQLRRTRKADINEPARLDHAEYKTRGLELLPWPST